MTQKAKDIRMTAILGDRMRRLMRRHGINQSQLAARAGTTQPNISKYLAGDREPSSGTLANIAAALHATSEYLLCFASIFLKQFLHYFSAVWAAGFQQELHHMTAQTRTGTGPPCLYIPET